MVSTTTWMTLSTTLPNGLTKTEMAMVTIQMETIQMLSHRIPHNGLTKMEMDLGTTKMEIILTLSQPMPHSGLILMAMAMEIMPLETTPICG